MEGTYGNTAKPKSTNLHLERSNDHGALPVELWDHIISLIEADADLAALCRTSRSLQSISERHLYRTILLGTAFDKPVQQSKLWLFSRSMGCLPLQALVTSLSIYLPRCQKLYMPTFATEYKECPCKTLEQLLGKIVTPLYNLQYLSINCYLCNSNTRHSYLQLLTTRRLTSLTFKCQCHDSKSAMLLKNFTGECMETVTCIEWVSKPNVYLDAALIGSGRFLPNVKQVSSGIVTPFVHHLRRGTITHLRCTRSTEQLPTVLINCPASLVYLHIWKADLVLPAIAQSPSPYRNIRSLAKFSFEFSNSIDIILTTLEVLGRLPYLNTIGIVLQFDAEEAEMRKLFHDNEQDRVLVSRLAEQVQTLCKVGVHISIHDNYGLGLFETRGKDTYQVWERNGMWKKTEIEFLGYQRAIEGEIWMRKQATGVVESI